MARGYRGYRGKNTGGWMVPVLCVLCIAAAAVSLLLHRCLVYTPEGTQLRLPFSDKTIPVSEEAEPEQVDLIIEEPVDVPTQAPVAEQAQSAVFVPIDAVLDGAKLDGIIAELVDSSVNTAVLEIKADDGRLAFVSQSPTAKAAGANAESNDAVKSALEKLGQKGINVCAQISCFRDNLVPYSNRSFALRTTDDLTWLDPQENRWLNPCADVAVDYAVQIVSEVYDLGFKEVILENLTFPTKGILSIIRYDVEDKQTAVNAFLDKVVAVAQEKGGKISGVYQESSTVSGQDLDAFTAKLHRIYTPNISQAQNIIEKLGEECTTRLVLRVQAGEEAEELGCGVMYYNARGEYTQDMFKE